MEAASEAVFELQYQLVEEIGTMRHEAKKTQAACNPM